MGSRHHGLKIDASVPYLVPLALLLGPFHHVWTVVLFYPFSQGLRTFLKENFALHVSINKFFNFSAPPPFAVTSAFN